MIANSKQPIRVLNAVWQLNSGDTEYAQVEVLRHLDREQIQMDFLVTNQFEGYYDSIVRDMGARIVLGKDKHRPGRNLRELAAINHRFGPYDVIHSHHRNSNNGAPLLRAAHQLNIPVRIAHNHVVPSNQDSVFDRSRTMLARYLTNKYCTHGLAVSRTAAKSLFGPKWENNSRFKVLPPGFDFDAFNTPGNHKSLRQKLEIQDDELLIAHVGNFDHAAELEFILAITFELKKHISKFRVVLIGDGPLLFHTHRQTQLAGLYDHVVILGADQHLPLLLPEMDAFISPVNTETLGRAVIKAQAAGLVCFLSDSIVSEAEIVPELFNRLPLDAGAKTWAKEIAAHAQAPITQPQALEKCLASDLDISISVEQLKQIYTSALN